MFPFSGIQKFQELKQNKISEESFNQTIQSYLGILKHCNSYKLQWRIQDWIYSNLKRKNEKSD